MYTKGLMIEVDWDTADAIMEAQLLYTYRDLSEQIKKFKAKKKLKDWEKEDLDHFERVLEGLELIGEWYVFDFHKKKKRKK
jgi:hypothetical protein